MKNNLHKLTLLILLLGLSVSVMVQSSVSQKINKIKMDLFYLYAEATMETEQEAQEMAYELLMLEVDKYVASKKKLSEADRVVIKDIVSKNEVLSVMRGTMHRVFIYVKKSDIDAANNVTEIVRTPVGDDNKSEQTADNQNQSASSSAAQDIAEISAAKPRSAKPQNIKVKKQESKAPVVDEEPQIEESAIAVEEPVAVQSPLSAPQQQVIDELLRCRDLAAVRARLADLRSRYKVGAYGAPANCQDVAGSYWVVMDSNGGVATVLGPGSDQRISYQTMTYASLNEFKGQNAVWFKLK